MKKLISIICCVLALTLCLTACGQSAASNDAGQALAKGGVLILSVNPEIGIEYDENGAVTGVTARNDDALAIINSCTGLIGQPTRQVVTNLVTAIGEAGYFVEEIEGERRQITLEIEPGSSLPNDAFLDEVIADIRDAVNQHDWSTPLVVEGESDFGISDYIDTDYGVDNDGVTDYEGESSYDATTDYDDTDYGPNNDGVTDYEDTDYGPNNDGVTDYSDYGTTDGQSDYNESNTNYGDSAYGDSGYREPAATNPPATSGSTDYSDYNDGNSNYDEGQSDYDDATSDYEVESDYGSSDYDDASGYGDSDYE